MTRIKDLQEALNNLDPFTAQEERSFDNRDKAFIRDIQIVNKTDKNSAIKIYSDSKNKSKVVLKKLGKNIRTKLKKYLNGSPKIKTDTSNFDNKKFTTPKRQKGTQKTKGSVNKEVKTYLENPKSQKDTTYSRVLKQSYLHPSASKYELQHGVNSKASKAYRDRREQNNKK